jgi:FMN phosphatase YigB (HAD superfamily)
MIRAIFFDFYSVWVPDTFSDYLSSAQQSGLDPDGQVPAAIEKYFQGEVTPEHLADFLRFKLNRSDIDANQFKLKEEDISPAVTTFMRNLHGHFVKLGVLANLGPQEYAILTDYNRQNQLFEVIAGPLPLNLKAPLLSQPVFAGALQAIGEPPASCLVVSGNPAYLQFAQSIGIATLQFNGLPSLQQTLDQLLTSELPH